MNNFNGNERRDWIRTAVQQYEGQLVRYASRITGDVERARDVVQDTFLKLCNQPLESVDGHLAEWLFRVCRNRALDVCRKEKRMKAITDHQADSQLSREPSQEDLAERRDSTAQVMHLMEGLSDNQQEVVRLKFQNGLSYREISRITELSVTNVGYLIHTAVQKLRKEMQGGQVLPADN